MQRFLTIPETVGYVGGLVPPVYQDALRAAEQCTGERFRRDLAILDVLGEQAAELGATAARERSAAQQKLAEMLDQLAQLMSDIDGTPVAEGGQAAVASMARQVIETGLGTAAAGGRGTAAKVGDLSRSLDEAASRARVAEPARGLLRDAVQQAVQIQFAVLALDGARDAKTATAEFIAKLNPLWAEKCTPRPATALVPGADVAKNDVLLIDTSTQKEVPGGKVVIIPADPKQPIPPPIPVKPDGTVTLPPVQPHDRLVLLPENHAKVELTGGNLPSETGARLAVPEKPLRLIVHDTPCSGVGDRIVEQGLADQYGVRLAPASRWRGTDRRFGRAEFQRADCLVEVPDYVPLKPGAPRGPITVKDGPTTTREGKIVEGDQPREVQGQ